jgi:hypothetical protein
MLFLIGGIPLKKIILVFLLNFIFSVPMADACGIFLSGQETNVRADQIEAAILIDQPGVENLVVQMNYKVNRGQVDQFGWIMPFPSPPTVTKVDHDFFSILKQATALQNNTITPYTSQEIIPYGAASQEVQVISRQNIGIYDISVIKATDTDSLLKWAKANKYDIPWLDESTVKSYIDNGWYFSLARITDVKAVQIGTLEPLKFTFQTNNPVYPISLAAYDPNGTVNSHKTIPVTLYLIGKEKLAPASYYHSQMTSSYSGLLDPQTKESLHLADTGARYITKWDRVFSADEIHGDLFVTPDSMLPAQPQQSVSVDLQLGSKSAYIDGQLKLLDVAPYTIDGRTMVPIRFLSEALGAKVDWIQGPREVDVTLNGIKISLWMGHTDKGVVNVNGMLRQPKLDIAPQMIDGRAMVPLRFISENLGLPVHYEPSTQHITIGSQGMDFWRAEW